MLPFIGAIINVFSWFFTGGGWLAQTARFVGATLLSIALGRQNQTGPRLGDLRSQTSTYGAPIPICYGTVRISGNVIDWSGIGETVHKKKKKVLGITAATQTWYTYATDLVIGLCEGPLEGALPNAVYANGKKIFQRGYDEGVGGFEVDASLATHVVYNRGTSGAVFSRLSLYRGFPNQPVNPITGFFAGSDAPAYRGLCFMVIQGLQLLDFGNGIPNIEVELYTGTDATVESAVKDMAARANVTVDATRVNAAVDGYAISRADSAWDAIEPLAGAFSFDFVESGAVFRVEPRGQAISASIPDGDLGAGAPSAASSRINLNRADFLRLPSEASVTYIDPALDYQPGTQRAIRGAGDQENKISVDTPVVMSADKARELADRVLWESWASARAVEFELTARWRELLAGSVVLINVDGSPRPYRILSVRKNPTGTVNVRATFDDPTIYTSFTFGESGTSGVSEPSLPGQTILQLIDGPITDDLDDDTGFYWAVSKQARGWNYATLERSEDAGSPYEFEELSDTFLSATIGSMVNTLPDGPVDVWDRVNQIEVTLFDATASLTSVTEGQALNGSNLAWIGAADGSRGEYVIFQTVSSGGSPLTYTLTNLIRGLYGTEHDTGAHVSGERFVLIEANLVNRYDFGPADWNLSRRYRAVTFQTGADDAATTDLANTGEGKRPLSVAQMRGIRNNVNDDIKIAWKRRTRYATPAIGAGDAPLGEASESYRVELGSPVVRTEIVTSPEYIYSEADQTADGHTLGAPVNVTVYQLSDVRDAGRGNSGVV